MKMSVTAKIKSIAWIVSKVAMLTAMAMLCIRFIEAYMAVGVWLCAISVLSVFIYAYAQKRVVNHPVHLRKFALFPGGTRQGFIT